MKYFNKIGCRIYSGTDEVFEQNWAWYLPLWNWWSIWTKLGVVFTVVVLMKYLNKIGRIIYGCGTDEVFEQNWA